MIRIKKNAKNMRTLKISLLAITFLSTQLAHAQSTDPAPYCEAGYNDLPSYWPHFISNVTLGTLNNSTGDTAYAAPHYVYYTNVSAPNLTAGNTYTLSVTHDPFSMSFHFIAAFIDYNHNNSFSDSGERIMQQRYTSITYPTSTASITIPATATTGTTRMRVMVFESDNYAAPNAEACTADTLEWGETEDYNVNITAPTGVTQVTQSTDAFLYPNPTRGTVYVGADLLGAEMTLTDVQGRVAGQYKITAACIDISSLTQGIYFARVIKNGLVYTQVLTVGQ